MRKHVNGTWKNGHKKKKDGKRVRKRRKYPNSITVNVRKNKWWSTKVKTQNILSILLHFKNIESNSRKTNLNPDFTLSLQFLSGQILTEWDEIPTKVRQQCMCKHVNVKKLIKEIKISKGLRSVTIVVEARKWYSVAGRMAKMVI